MQDEINSAFKRFSEKYGLKTGASKKSGAIKKKAPADSTTEILASIKSTVKEALLSEGFAGIKVPERRQDYTNSTNLGLEQEVQRALSDLAILKENL